MTGLPDVARLMDEFAGITTEAQPIEGTVEVLPIAPCEVCGAALVMRSRDVGEDMAEGWFECPNGHPLPDTE